jgi:UDP-N-acetylglucosamine acyltransferase
MAAAGPAMALHIHPGACVHPEAVVGDGTRIGPGCVVGPGVRIGRDCELVANVCVYGPAVLGDRNVVHPGAVLGGPPQDLTYRGEPTDLVIGDGNTFRELVTVNRGTVKGGGRTTIGNDNLLMASVHVAHDCILGNRIVIANGVLLGGHVLIQDEAWFGGLAALHHYVTVGTQCFIGGMARITQDVPPFMTVEGHPARVRCVNVVGLRRRGYPPAEIEALRAAHRLLWRSPTTRHRAAEELLARPDLPGPVRTLAEFVLASEQGRQGRAREAQRRPPP